jgi:ABC-2 type transport system permease protein
MSAVARGAAGAGRLLRLGLRRDRVAIPAWVIGIAGEMVLASSSIQSLYPTAADRARFASGLGDQPALVAIRGPARALDTPGGEVAWQVGWFAMVLAGLMSVLLVVRHTRADEETGRTELVLAGPVARPAPLVAAVAVATGANAAVAVAVALGLIALGLPATGSVVLGASIGAAGLVFAAVAAVTAQLTESARAARGLAVAALGAAYVLRAIGDVGDGRLSWLSPIGWAQAARPYAGDRGWPLALAIVATAALLGLAARLLAGRDLGAGLIAPRPGPGVGSPALTRPLGLALRLQRGALAGWGAGVILIGVAYGSLGQNVREVLDTSSQVEEIFTRPGADVVDSYFATACLVIALLGTGFAIQATLRLRGEEAAGRAEPVLATALSRPRWAASHLAVALAGTTLVVGLAGAAAGLSYGLRGAGLDEVPRLAGAALVHAPATWVLGGIALAVFGLAPRAAAAAWAPLAYCFTAATLGPLLGLPGWMEDLSPYAHTPALPADDLAAGPLVALTAIAAALVAVGLVAYRRRDAA